MLRPFAALLCLSALAGCTGTSTYGTGTTQEMQLVKDVTNLVSLKSSKPAKIAYEERPGLVKPGGRDLPPPVELASAKPTDGVSAFPVSPEQQRARRRAAAARGEKVAATRAAGADDNLSDEDRKYMNWSGAPTPGYRRWLSKRARTLRKPKANVRGDGPRKYLTQPPQKYRKPYESAPQGEVGEAESTKEFKKKSKGNIFSKLLGRG